MALESLTEYALITTDGALAVNSWSGPAAAMFGYTEREILGRSISLLFTPEDIARGVDRREFTEALSKGRRDDERWHVRKDGRRLWCYGLSFPLKDHKGAVRGFVKLIRDDTERKKKDDLLREDEERLRLAAESTGLGTWDYDIARRTFLLSERASVLFGQAGSGGGFEQIIRMVHPDDRERISRDFARAVAGRASEGQDMEYRIKTPEGPGPYRWVRTMARPYGGAPASAAPRRILGTVIDITEERRMRAEERELNEELERKVRERTSQLQALNKELESFAYSASHDLRAPLRKISAFSEAILRSEDSVLGAADRAYFERIMAAAAKMHRLIDDMLSLMRVTRKPLERIDCDLTRIALEIVDALKKGDPGRKVEVVVAADVRAEGDGELLTIALRNLLDNAWKFTSQHAEARIEFGVKRTEGPPVFFVKDDGAGFDMRFAHKLFGAFSRLHPEDQFAGTGVGLGIVERIVRRHRGRIWAESKVEEGAAFFFTLYSEGE